MAKIVAPGVCRYTVHGTTVDRPWAVILDMDIETTGSNDSRDLTIFNVAGDIINNWVEYLLPLQDSSGSLTGVSWVDLDSINGITGSRSNTSEYTLPLPGGSSGGLDSSATAVLVRKELAGAGRGSRPGRMYFPGPSGSAYEDNVLGPSSLATWQTAFDTFFDNITDDGGLLDYALDLCVVHTPGIDGYGPGDTYNATSTHVVAMSVQPRVATQRRRLRG